MGIWDCGWGMYVSRKMNEVGECGCWWVNVGECGFSWEKHFVSICEPLPYIPQGIYIREIEAKNEYG